MPRQPLALGLLTSFAAIAVVAVSRPSARAADDAPAAKKPAGKAAAADAAEDEKPKGKKARVIPEGVTIEHNVTYLQPERKEKLDLYLPTDRAKGVKSPAILMIHGGGWVAGDKDAAREFNVGTTMAKAGYVCASVNYQMAEGDRWPTNLFDCKNAVRFLRKNADKYQIDVDKVGVIGGSAGGHLALMVGYSSEDPDLEPKAPYPGVSDKVSAVVDLYGIADVRTRQKIDPDGTPAGQARDKTALFPTVSLEQDPALWAKASPVTHVKKSSPPTLILHGTKDTTVDRDQPKQLAAKLKEAGVEHQLIMIEGVGHTFDLTTWRGKPLPTDMTPVVLAFFDKHVKGK